jgi:hypothetical protein
MYAGARIVVLGGTHQRVPNPTWVIGCKVVVVVRDSLPQKTLDLLRRAIADVTSKPPFSKYQLEIGADVVRQSKIQAVITKSKRHPLFRYTQGHFWRSSPVTSSGLFLRRIVRLPDIVSDICVNERPAY